MSCGHEKKEYEIIEKTLNDSTMLFQYVLSYFHFFSYFVQPALLLYAISYVSHLSFFTQVRF